MDYFIKILAFCLGLTILLETAFAIFAGVRGRKNLLTVVLVQVMTNPCVVLLMYWCMTHLSWHHALYELPIETVVVIVEGLIYKMFVKDIKRPFAFSLVANYFSYSFGILMGYFGIYPQF